jgi:flagellar motor switch protein FliM
MFWPAICKGSQVTITGMKQSKTASRTDLTVHPNELPVRLTFELSRIELSFAELQELQPGYVFSLADGGPAIAIFANGVAVGSGELVRIGDHLGVRVVEWFEDSPAASQERGTAGGDVSAEVTSHQDSNFEDTYGRIGARDLEQ